MTNFIKRHFYRKALMLVFNICLDMRGDKRYDWKTLAELQNRLEQTMFPKDFEN